jgi:hypothetical protein
MVLEKVPKSPRDAVSWKGWYMPGSGGSEVCLEGRLERDILTIESQEA